MRPVWTDRPSILITGIVLLALITLVLIPMLIRVPVIEGPVRLVGDDAYPPFSFATSPGDPWGYEAQLVGELQRVLGVTIQYHQVSWQEALDLLDTGEVHGVTGMRLLPERAEKYAFTRPYLNMSLVMVTMIGERGDLSPEEYLPGKLIATHRGSATGLVAQEMGAQIKEYDSPLDAMESLLEGEVQGWVEFNLTAQHFLRASCSLVEILPLPGSDGEYGMAFAQGYEHLALQFSRALSILEREGVLSSLDNQWFGVSISRHNLESFMRIAVGILVLLFLVGGGLTVINWSLQRRVRLATSQIQAEKNRLKDQLKATAVAFGSAIQEKDPYTGGHSLRVARYSVSIGEELGLGEEELLDLELAAILHDVGKIGIPGAILRKQGRLTQEEYQAIQEHPERGARILSGLGHSAVFWGALYHHERYDGRIDLPFPSYPRQKHGEEIPLVARIICVADAFDAMTSHRSYRPNLTLMEAKAELLRQRGAQFDPCVVDAFLRSMSDAELAEVSGP